MASKYYTGSEWRPDPTSSHLELRRRRASETLPHLLGRLIFGGYFVYNGINHFMHRRDLSGYARAKHVPAADVAVPGSGALLLLGGVSMLTGYRPKLGAALIMAFLAGVSPAMHAFWKEENPQQRQGEMVNFLKNVALLGGALLAAGSREPWPLAAGKHAA